MSTLEKYLEISHAADVSCIEIDLNLVAGVISADPPILSLITISRRNQPRPVAMIQLGQVHSLDTSWPRRDYGAELCGLGFSGWWNDIGKSTIHYTPRATV